MSMLIIKNETINNLLKNNTLVQEFPLLQARLVTPVKTKKCCNKKKPVNSVNYDAIKSNILKLPEDRKKKFKEVLGVEKVCVYYSKNGKVVKEIF